jgi:hypothetical protein
MSSDIMRDLHEQELERERLDKIRQLSSSYDTYLRKMSYWEIDRLWGSNSFELPAR